MQSLVGFRRQALPSPPPCSAIRSPRFPSSAVPSLRRSPRQAPTDPLPSFAILFFCAVLFFLLSLLYSFFFPFASMQSSPLTSDSCMQYDLSFVLLRLARRRERLCARVHDLSLSFSPSRSLRRTSKVCHKEYPANRTRDHLSEDRVKSRERNLF